MKNFKKIILVTLIACMTIMPFATGCKKKTDSNVTSSSASSSSSSASQADNNNATTSNHNAAAETPVQPDALPAGVETVGQMNTAQQLHDLNVTCSKIEAAYGNVQDNGKEYLEISFSVMNSGAEAITISQLAAFKVYVDGTEIPNAAGSSNALMAVLTSGTTAEALTGTINSGSTLNGFVAVEMPETWKELKLEFAPFQSVSNDFISYTFNYDDVAR